MSLCCVLMNAGQEVICFVLCLTAHYDLILINLIYKGMYTERGNVAEYNKICLSFGKWSIILSNIPLKSWDNNLSACMKENKKSLKYSNTIYSQWKKTPTNVLVVIGHWLYR
jgi:hypothetical protein